MTARCLALSRPRTPASGRGPKPHGLAAGVLALLLLAGCAGTTPEPTTSPAANPDLAGLQWGVMSVRTTPVEPLELVGDVQVTWTGGVFAIHSESEPDLRPRTVIVGDRAYEWRQMAWTEWPLAAGLRDGRLSNRVLLWDLPRLLAAPGLTVEVARAGDTLNVTASGTLGGYRVPLEVHVEVGAVGGRVVWARVDAPLGREAPFTFHEDPRPFPFEAAVPAVSKPGDEAVAGNRKADASHRVIIRLVMDYQKTHGNTLPETLDAQSLRVEMLAAGATWPENPFTGEPMRSQAASGDFVWRRCSLTDGHYQGLGWDGILITKGFGLGCGSG